MDLAPCPRCRRHVAASEMCCPFCSAALAAPVARTTLAGRAGRAMIFGAALTAAACGGKTKSYDREEHHGGGGCSDPDKDEIARLEKAKAEATTDEEKQAIDEELQRARQPVCMPYGAPPKRTRVV